jgi:PAT family beta-lactamase induction signal transducer AmpG
MTVSPPPPTAPDKDIVRKKWAWLEVFTTWRMLVVAMMGFASGLPMALTGTAMQAWLVKEGFNVEKIGWLGLVALPYSLKFLWSPLMDRYVPPMLGRRRGWVLLCQLALIVVILGMAATGFQGGLTLAAVLLTCIAFCSASQDIAIDAYRTDLLKPVETGAGSAAAIMGWRVGFIFSGAAALMLADKFGSWQGVYALMAGCMGVTLIAGFLAPEPETKVKPPQTFQQAVVLPFREFLWRRGAWQMLLFILIYKLDWAMVYWASTPFVQKTLGFQQAEIGAANGIGMGVTIAGAVVGGSLLTMIGMRRALWTFGILQGLAGASYATLALVGKSYAMLATAVCVENFCSGMATAAFTGFLMVLCDKRFTATQYALLSSLFALSRTLISVPAGWFTQNILHVTTDGRAWAIFFVCSILVSVPGLLLLLKFRTWQMPQLVSASVSEE